MDKQLSEQEIKKFFAARRVRLATIEQRFGRKFVQTVQDKITDEEQQALTLINAQDKSQAQRERYSFVLNPNYFEQQFLG